MFLMTDFLLEPFQVVESETREDIPEPGTRNTVWWEA